MLFRISRLWYCPSIRTSNTESTPICTIAHTYIRCARIRIYISRGHQNAAMCWILMNVPDSEMPSTKRIWRLYYVLQLPTLKDITPRRGLITGAKLQIYFELCKYIYKKSATYVRKHKWRMCWDRLKREVNLNKTHFCDWEFPRCSLVRLWFLLGLLQGGYKVRTKERNLNKKAYEQKKTMSNCPPITRRNMVSG